MPDTAAEPRPAPDVTEGTVVPSTMSRLLGLFRFAGPGLLIAVGYMDPGNWATDIEAGSRFGYALLFVVVACGVAAMLLQDLAARVGIVTGHDIAQLARDRYPRPVVWLLWALAEIAMIATDIAEVLGGALALHLLFDLPLWIGVLLTGFDTVIVLALKGQGFRTLEAIVAGLVATITACFLVQLVIARPDVSGILGGLVPSGVLANRQALYLAIGILGATVMPHNLYLHSSVVNGRGDEQRHGVRDRLRFSTFDTVGSLGVATVVNALILIVSAAVFHANGHRGVAEISDAYHLLAPLTGAALAPILFGVALFASGQSATFTGTMAGQVVLEGFLGVHMPGWLRRIITRGLALVPALIGVLVMGDGAVGKLIVLTQVVLSLQLPFALAPLLLFASNRTLMGEWAIGWKTRAVAWAVFTVITVADIALLVSSA